MDFRKILVLFGFTFEILNQLNLKKNEKSYLSNHYII